jgi:uncharacterized protein (TIGR00369 family)
MKPQPNSKHCFVCGLANPFGLQLKFYSSAPGEVTAEYTVPERYQGYPGLVHGGIVAAMLDEVAGRAHMADNPERFLYTARLEVRYRRHVPLGKPLRLVGRVGRDKGRTATSSAVIYDEDGNVLAEAEALLVEVPPEVIGGVDLEALGWRVYEEENVGGRMLGSDGPALIEEEAGGGGT